jgi:hypothetical protein
MAFPWISRLEIGGQTRLLQPRRQRGYDPAMSDDTPETPTLPDRLSVNPQSPFYDAALLERGIGIRFNGADKTNVEEYCVSEGWVRLAVGKTVDRHGNAMTVKYKGKVEPYFR